MSFQQALSGLNVASRVLDITSNNIANASTAGFKIANGHFADVYANSLSGTGASQVGIGSSVGAIQQNFSQGNITATNNPLDIAINGGGFFRMSDQGTVNYSRNGQFHLNNNGYIVDDKGRQLTGYPADGTGKVIQSSPVPLQLSVSDQQPVATGSGLGSFKGVKSVVNLDSRALGKTWVAGAPLADGTPTSPNSWAPDPANYNWTTALSIYDSLGNAHTLSLYACKSPTDAGAWDIHATVDGTSDKGVKLTNSTLQFTAGGKLNNAIANNGVMSVAIDLDGAMGALGKTNSATSPLTFDLDFTGSSQYGSAFGVNRLDQDGYTSGHLSGVTVGSDGVIKGNYSNGQSRDLGQVALASFANPNGLASLGGNQWAETSISGAAMVGAPGTSSLGVLQASSIEESNVDLTAELVNMITQQRNYQANAQSIKTQDQIMQTLVNLR